MLLAGKGNCLIENCLIAITPNKGQQCFYDRIHMLDLKVSQIFQAGRHSFIFSLAANSLQVSDRCAELVTRHAGSQDGCVIKLAHVSVDSINFCLDMISCAQISCGCDRYGTRGNGSCSLLWDGGRGRLLIRTTTSYEHCKNENQRKDDFFHKSLVPLKIEKRHRAVSQL